ncbi:helix-turn-helix transcriptional regulator [Aliarcobacter thereius]|uniref:DNA-binding protein n=2 Tax=Aliarcobacter thereius TaxID=544718 RepID=A0A1C0B548_9BACT|nr:hypothetical protein [Aliarcobacter thereius]OCL95535.1 hypothetical protein AA347_01000 [Aliarcobacter thereius LMG 24486]OCL97563.1 hypothetical protein AAX29_01923 [Aliarcobacter thereius]QBF16478.1 hypothetical protein ATH_1447 [Aliarcobacter thereius LMG 24486]TLS72944.1 DNA-binding protein [Aliarcobacter thereius]TLS91528.1 DNA-binding protein [Aliarcobacter thereius]
MKELEKQTPKYMRAKDLAKHLGIGLSTVWLFAKQGRITPKKITPKITVFNIEEAEKSLLVDRK